MGEPELQCVQCETNDTPGNLVHTCRCLGNAVKHVHRRCAKQWYIAQPDNECPQCRGTYAAVFEHRVQPERELYPESGERELFSTASRAKHPVAYIALAVVFSIVAGAALLFLVYFVALGATNPEDWSTRWKVISVFVYLSVSLAVALVPHHRHARAFIHSRGFEAATARLFTIKFIYDVVCIVSFTRKKVSSALFLSFVCAFFLVNVFSLLVFKYRTSKL